MALRFTPQYYGLESHISSAMLQKRHVADYSKALNIKDNAEDVEKETIMTQCRVLKKCRYAKDGKHLVSLSESDGVIDLPEHVATSFEKQGLVKILDAMEAPAEKPEGAVLPTKGQVEAMKAGELKGLLDAAGVEYPGSANKAMLQQLVLSLVAEAQDGGQE